MPCVQDADRPPYDAFGLLRVSLEGGGGWGTACLIDERYLLTCAHNVFHRKNAARGANFYRAHNAAHAPSGEGAIVDCAFVKRAFHENHDRSWDIAVLRLTQSIYNVRPVRLQVATKNEPPEPELRIAKTQSRKTVPPP